MTTTRVRTEQLCIVDPRRIDYAGLAEEAQAAALCLRYFRRAGEALRDEQDRATCLWIVNARLPDLSGFELCEMLRRPPRSGTVVCVVSDAYSSDDERAARASGASVYVGKPLTAGLLSCWLESLVPRLEPAEAASLSVGPEPAASRAPRVEGSRRGFVAARRPRRSFHQGTTS